MKRARDGKYSFDGDMERLCVCGHKLGYHLDAPPHGCLSGTGVEPEGEEPGEKCDCQKFRPSKAHQIHARLFPSDRSRKKTAAEVWERLRAGPSFSHFGDEPFTPATATADYRRWVRFWVLTEVARLVPELREKLDTLGYVKQEETL